MISQILYDKIKLKYGQVASWAIWEEQGNKPKSNMGADNIFSSESNPTLLNQLQTNNIFVGLNFSRHVPHTVPFANFHDLSPYANDFKIRYALKGTNYIGSYMTDILKNLVIPDAQRVRDFIKVNPDSVKPHVEAFEEELSFIQSSSPRIIAFGRDAHNLIKKHIDRNLYSELIQVTHYSHQIKKEEYRTKIHEVLGVS